MTLKGVTRIPIINRKLASPLKHVLLSVRFHARQFTVRSVSYESRALGPPALTVTCSSVSFSVIYCYMLFHALLSVGPIYMCFFWEHDLEENKFFRHRILSHYLRIRESLFLFVLSINRCYRHSLMLLSFSLNHRHNGSFIWWRPSH